MEKGKLGLGFKKGAQPSLNVKIIITIALSRTHLRSAAFVANATSLALLRCAAHARRYVGKTTKGKVPVELGKNQNHIQGFVPVHQKNQSFSVS